MFPVNCRSQIAEKVSEPKNVKAPERNSERIVCQICSCEFSRNAAYERHLRKHNNAKTSAEEVIEHGHLCIAKPVQCCQRKLCFTVMFL